MARRYSRDNRGRFASGGTGATARGGRLKTASGNKRATQTTKAAAAKPSGTVAGKVKRNPAAAGKIGKAKVATKRPARIKGTKINSLDAPNKASSAPKGTIGKTGKIRTAQAFDRNLAAAKLNAPAGRKNAVSVEQRYKTTTSDFASLGGSASGRLTRKQLDKRQRQGQKILNPTSSITDVSPTYSGMSSSMKQRVKEARATRFEGYKSAISAKRTAKPAAAKPAKAASRPDTAASNIPMRGARGRALNAEISRNVNAQKTASRAASKAIGRQLKSDQSRAKKLREVHLGPLAAGYAQRSGRKVADVKAAISGMAPSGQIKLFRQYVRENRKKK
jgi:hypothetical protein